MKKQLTKEEMDQLRETAKVFDDRKAQRTKEQLAGMNAEQQEFVKWNSYYRNISEIRLGRKMTAAFDQGMKPSEFIMKEMQFLFDTGYIPKRYQENLLAAADALTERQYSSSWYRRSFRSRNYAPYAIALHTMIDSFHGHTYEEVSVIDALRIHGTPEFEAYARTTTYWRTGFLPETIAFAVDSGDTEVKQAVIDILNGEGEYDIGADIIKGIMLCHDAEMHEWLCKLLKAAKLQEGLRQAICESADCGTAAAFRAVLGTIREENLIRFSSVKRAVGTWTGLVAADSKDLERVSEKTVAQMCELLDSEEARQAALQTEDSMAIYLALWAYGFYSVEDAIQKITLLAETGTHHQVLTAGYFLANIDNAAFGHQVAKIIIKRHSKDYDIMAVTLPHLCKNWKDSLPKKTGRFDLKDESTLRKPDWDYLHFFDSAEETAEYHAIMQELMQAVPKKELVFSPCIFPWYSAALTKADLALRVCVTASILGDQDKLDEAVKLIPLTDPARRDSVIEMLLSAPQTDAQRLALTDALCDKENFSRKTAFELICKTEITAAQYREMEALLKYKAQDARANIVALLLKQDDAALKESVTRLLSDKKEEKRTAGLDLIMQICADENRAALAGECRAIAAGMENPTDKERILLTQILGEQETGEAQSEASLYSEDDVYTPVLSEEYLQECITAFKRYYPDTQLFSDGNSAKGNADCASYQDAADRLNQLDKILESLRGREFTCWNGEVKTVDCEHYFFQTKEENNTHRVAFREEFEKWYDESGCTPEIFERMCIAERGSKAHFIRCDRFFGQGFTKPVTLHYPTHICEILNDLKLHKVQRDTESLADAGYALLHWILHELPEEERFVQTESNYDKRQKYSHFLEDDQIYHCVNEICSGNAHKKERFDLRLMLERQYHADERSKQTFYRYYEIVPGLFPSLREYIQMTFRGDYPERALFRTIFESEKNLKDALELLSHVNGYVRDAGQVRAKRGSYYQWRLRRSVIQVGSLAGNDDLAHLTEEQQKILQYGADLFDRIIAVVLPVELHRGDTETKYSKCIRSTQRISGTDNLLSILQAFGKDSLERSTYYSGFSKKTNLSYLLSVCVPTAEDTAALLAEKIKQTDIAEQRLIEAALYAPEWLPIIAEYLNWDGFMSGCYYFMAHMNERFDDRRRAMIAKYTPLTEEELNLGAFDIEWFKSAYETLGKKRFGVIYDAAKYISDGAKHSRARKYADAVQGKLDAEKTAVQIADKRNKDLVMAYALIPFKDEDELSKRYLRIVQYRKEAKKFGAQRSASERKAAEIALQNLAMNAGFADVTRLTLRMETKLLDDSRVFFEGITIDDTCFRLVVDEDGKCELEVTKNGKALKSIPAKYKKNEQVLAIQDTKKILAEQYRRTREMMEQAMEEQTVWHADELQTLLQNPVAAPIIGRLVFAHDGKFGFLRSGQLVSADGEAITLKADDAMTVAHPYLLWSAKIWADYQKYCFTEKLVQPFKQVFRELYIKTPEEAAAARSLRYAGNQIQPAKTVACLKSRRWIADVEDGLQKVFYKENLVATIYAMADWFSPADIEAPTLEYVAFYDRKTGEPKTISEIPDVLFSEVMRDVDLAVSVAHAGGVDPETSHSTVEMRAALLEMSMPLLGMENVKIEGHHAHIKGQRAEYTVHLGSGVVHIKGGAMLNILPVHSQHRGRIFLPFADDDPKTAEILSKILLLSEDTKIQDPSIISQI